MRRRLKLHVDFLDLSFFDTYPYEPIPGGPMSIWPFIGMVLVNTHPDYLIDPVSGKLYADFLQAMQRREGYWHALSREVARWWRARTACITDVSEPCLSLSTSG